MLKRLSRDEAPPSRAAEPGFDLLEIIGFAWRRWKFITGVTALALLLGLIHLARQTPLFTATTQVLLDVKRTAPVGNAAEAYNPAEIDYNVSKIENEIAILRSNSLLARVVEKERLTSDTEFGAPGLRAMQSRPGFAASLMSMFRAAPPEGATVEPGPAGAGADTPAAAAASIAALRGAVSVTRAGFSSVLAIALTSTDPQRAARLANAVADAYAVDKLDARFESAKRASAWLSDRIEEIRTQLRESEEAVVKFKAENGIVQTNANATLSQDQLTQLNTRLMAARADSAEKKARVDLLNSIEAKGGSAQGIPDAMASATISALRTQEADVSRREADLVARYGDRHPLVVNVRAEHRDVQRAIGAEVQRIAANVRNEYELAKSREDAVAKTVTQATGQSGTDDKIAIRLRELERTAAVNKTVFEEFLQKAKISEEQSSFEARDVRVIAPAEAPGEPSSPNRNRVITVALLLGLLAGIGGAFAIEKLNAGFTSVQQVEELLALPVLASMNHVSAKDLLVNGKATQIPYLPELKPLSRQAEAIRSLRAGVQMADVDNAPKVVMVTSSLPGEGKTTLALMLATSVAVSGQRVLFIDADLRRPSASKLVGRDKGAGIVEVLLGQAEPQDIVKLADEGKFWVMPAGGRTQNPPDILASERMKSLIAQLRKSFDYIVIDTPPMGPVLDGLVVSALVDKIVYVIKWGATPRGTVEQSIRKLEGGRKVAGAVFNMVKESEARKYGRYAYAYYGKRAYDKYYAD